jgi:hypothetical protein
MCFSKDDAGNLFVSDSFNDLNLYLVELSASMYMKFMVLTR